MNAQVFQLSSDALAPFVESLREGYPGASVRVEVIPAKRKLTEKEFWAIISLLDWSKTGDDSAVIEPAVAKLASLPNRMIYEFKDLLSEKLYHLDTRNHALNAGENSPEDEDFSVDEFLFARCCAVANGKSAYESAVENPEEMPKDMEFEAILDIADEAFQRKNNHVLRYVPAFNIETGSNKKGWKL